METAKREQLEALETLASGEDSQTATALEKLLPHFKALRTAAQEIVT